MILRVVVTGGRDYDNRGTVSKEMSKLVKMTESTEKLLVVNGGAPGLDTLVIEVCDQMGIPCATVYAPWNSRFGRGAGPVRNRWMIDLFDPAYGIVFPGGKGTADMKRRIIAAGINFHEVTS